jgi:hypothetical protein
MSPLSPLQFAASLPVKVAEAAWNGINRRIMGDHGPEPIQCPECRAKYGVTA